MHTFNIQYINVNKDENYESTFNPNVEKANLINPDGIIWTFEKHVVDTKDWCTLKLNNMDYDLYLMHDLEKWYVLYISRQTLGKVLRHTDTIINDEDFLKDGETIELYSDDRQYRLKYETYNNQFLINRYKFIPTEGDNEFNRSSIICGVLSNNRLGVNVDISSKWNISRPTLHKVISPSVESNQEMTIISVNNDNLYKPGYYNVNVRYSLDGITNNQYVKNCILKVKE